MRLYEAIRLGSKLHPQGFGGFRNYQGGTIVTCAIGAVGEAIGLDLKKNINAERLRHHWPWMFQTSSPCPVCQCEYQVICIITHLNDDHRWTRERIADWVETIEPQEPLADPAPACVLTASLAEEEE